jgi:mRNA-degrading endonuclease YafQ of YafQ-DinJ toxin-antitoxin module
VGIKSKYQVKTRQEVRETDLPNLSQELQEIFQDICDAVFVVDPYNCSGFPNHALKGKLKGYRALEIDWNQVSYRLVYRIYEKPSPRRVLVISFAEHDPAYEKAVARVKN